jgi:hypothetical protein
VEDPGSFGAGLAAGLMCGVIGFGLVQLVAKGAETKRGARYGFMIQLGLGILIRILALSAQ